MNDVVCVWNGKHHNLNLLLHSLNNHYPNISNTLENGGRTSNFLDRTISLQDINDHELSPSFAIHRKPTFTCISTYQCSFHLCIHKMAFLHSFIIRLHSIICCPDAYKMEICNMQAEAHRNGLISNVHQLILCRKKLKQLLNLHCQHRALPYEKGRSTSPTLNVQPKDSRIILPCRFLPSHNRLSAFGT